MTMSNLDDLKFCLSEEDTEGLFEALRRAPHIPDVIGALRDEGIELVVELCKKGFTEVLELLISVAGLDILEEDFPETLVQTACRHNQKDILELLLFRGLDLLPPGVQVWQKQSPFAIATEQGHLDIVRTLLDHQPSLVKQEEVRSCLLYQACLGGHLDLVKIWLTPSMDLNHPLKLVESLEDCENKTPLYAACVSGNREVIKFLMEATELQFTKCVCQEFPEIIGEFFQDYFEPYKTLSTKAKNALEDDMDDCMDGLFELIVGNLRGHNLNYLHPSWVEPHRVTLVELDLRDNNLQELPDCLPWGFQNLRSLIAIKNKIKSLAPPPEDVEELCPSLEEFNLSHNQLERVCRELFDIPALTELNLSHNRLQFLTRSYHQQGELQQDIHSIITRQSSGIKPWMCNKLKLLDISHNALQLLPEMMKGCEQLTHLHANNNNLSTFPQPWDCPLVMLNVSHNQMERFPVNTEQYWQGSLKTLNISNNLLDEINEGVVKLSVLVDLFAAHNKIERLPAPDLWECGHLYHLDLKHNRLGLPPNSPTKKPFNLARLTKSRTSVAEERRILQFPEVLETCLKELRLSDNNLDCVPQSVCNLRLLEILDLSDNHMIRSLPNEIGKLKNCGVLKLRGLTLDNVPQDMYTGKANKTREIIMMFMEKLRNCKTYNRVKTVVLGKKDKGKTTLVNILANNKVQIMQERKCIEREEITLVKRKGSFSLPLERRPEVVLNVWDMAGDECYSLIHHSMFTPNSLYLLVWDFWSIESELDKIGQWLYNIQASTPNFSAVLVGTFLDKMHCKSEEKEVARQKLQALLDQKFQRLNSKLELCPISCINNEGIDKLKHTIYEKASTMKAGGRRGGILVERMVPESYLLLESLIADTLKSLESEKQSTCLSQTRFLELVESLQPKDCDLMTQEENTAVTRFLVESGSLLHFSDQLGALNTLYFLDPAWLCDVLVHILNSKEGRRLLKTGTGKIRRDDVLRIYEEDSRFPLEFKDQYVELLERFEIAVSVNKSNQLFFPCQLPEDLPMNVSSNQDKQMTKTIRRLYRMAECPSGFWTRLLTRMMTRIDQFSTQDWFFKPILTQSVRKLSARPRSLETNKKNMLGLRLVNPNQTFCREWMYVQHAEGSFCVEPVCFAGDETAGLQKGVLITDNNQKGNFGIMGVIVDEIEDIIQDFYPGLLDLDEETMEYKLERYALCPTCYQGMPLPHQITHFTMEHCARMLVNSNFISCPQGVKHDLESLVPDLLMKELPAKFTLDISQLELKETQGNFLGGGVTGSVFKAKYHDQYVAVKVYRSDIRNKLPLGQFGSLNSNSSDSGTATMSTQGSVSGDQRVGEEKEESHYANCFKRGQVDLDETESIKAYKALKEMRQEVALTSRLQHPCIISLIGIAFSPKLMMALELAPLGSLRNILDIELKKRPVFNKYKDKDKTFPPLYSKELTFKFVFQIAKGLSYLHAHGIIYKDLKSDNILALSLDMDAMVNLKLSDYGISKYCWSGRSVGLVGTPGYQAPEILDGLAYDEKVDIFSLSMVVYEILTGRRPFHEFESMAQITKALKLAGKRPNVEDSNVVTHFPYLEYLMMKCWEKDASRRPKADSITSKSYLQNMQFLSQSASFKMAVMPDCAICVSEEDQHSLLWIWDGEAETRTCSILDVEMAQFRMKKRSFPGSRVMCIAKVAIFKHIWIGTQDCEIEIHGLDPSGSLSLVEKCKLEAMPIQILALRMEENRDSMASIFVALETGQLLMFQTRTSQSGEEVMLRRKTKRKVVGYTDPKTIVLRSDFIFCFAHAPETQELWISTDGHIDIVSVKDFKVKSSDRLTLEAVYRMFDLDTSLKITEMVGTVCGHVFCLLYDSPFVLQYKQMTYDCVGIIWLGNSSLHGSIVLEPATSRKGRDQNLERVKLRSRSESSEDSDSIIEDLASLSRSRELAKDCDIDKPPALPPRRKGAMKTNTPKLMTTESMLKIQKVLGKEVILENPPVPPRSPMTDRRNTCFVSDAKQTLCAKKSRSLPIRSERNTSTYGVVLTSIAVEKDVLWVGRSNGDICIIDIGKSSSDTKTEGGKVIAVMREVNHKKRTRHQNEHIRLVRTNKYMASLHMLPSDADDSPVAEVDVASWDCYAAADIARIENYWTSILRVEKSLAVTDGEETRKTGLTKLGEV